MGTVSLPSPPNDDDDDDDDELTTVGCQLVGTVPAVLPEVTDGVLLNTLDVVSTLPVRRRALPRHCTRHTVDRCDTLLSGYLIYDCIRTYTR